MVAPDRKDTETPQQVKVALAIRVDQICALALSPFAVEADRTDDPAHLMIEVAIVERHLLAVTIRVDRLYQGRRCAWPIFRS